MLKHTSHATPVPPDTGLEQSVVAQRHVKQLKNIAKRNLKEPDGVIERTVECGVEQDLVASRRRERQDRKHFRLSFLESPTGGFSARPEPKSSWRVSGPLFVW